MEEKMRAEYQGIVDDMLRLVEKKQLKDRGLWKLVSGQFAKTPDDADHGWRGEYWGKLMRGACMTWQYSRNALRDKNWISSMLSVSSKCSK